MLSEILHFVAFVLNVSNYKKKCEKVEIKKSKKIEKNRKKCFEVLNDKNKYIFYY